MRKVVWVLWEDAHGGNGPHTFAEVNAMGSFLVESAGILVSEDEDTMRIAQDSWSSDDEDRCRDHEVIPKKYILKSKTFNTPRRSNA